MAFLLNVRPAAAAFAVLLDAAHTAHEKACGQDFGEGTTISLAEGLSIGDVHDELHRAIAALKTDDDAMTQAFRDGQYGAIDNAAMKAYDMGHPEVRDAINALIDDIRNPPRVPR